MQPCNVFFVFCIFNLLTFTQDEEMKEKANALLYPETESMGPPSAVRSFSFYLQPFAFPFSTRMFSRYNEKLKHRI